MAYTLEDYNTLKSAIASGALRVEYGDKKIEYRTFDDMLKTLALMESDLGLNNKNSNNGRTIGNFSRGL